jgi:hypothetical protein
MVDILVPPLNSMERNGAPELKIKLDILSSLTPLP